MPIVYKGQSLSTPLVLDLLVDGLVIVECKATAQYNNIYESQTLTYLRVTGLKLSLVVNFGERGQEWHPSGRQWPMETREP